MSIIKTYLLYDPETGLVRGRSGGTNISAMTSLPEGRAVVEVDPESEAANEHDYTAFYVEQGTAYRRRPADVLMSGSTLVANGTASVTIERIPKNSKLVVSGVVQAGPLSVTDGSVVLTSTKVGEIKVSLDCPAPYSKWEGTIYAT